MSRGEEAKVAPGYPNLKSLRWRVDVTLSTNQTRRVLKPYLLMSVETSKGEHEMFEVTLEQFHKLRYAVSRSLNELLKAEGNDQLQRLKQ
ncbi:COMM domain-containing protein [Chloropicon primus]|uniref:COMM domain-containing protein 5 n=1 Tax=Chloropicon primus TaxID=1764295 RepID=A0A5B8MWZ8_9CHLO|nr:COMM domain-containing protein [Chloropicon primus]UPR03413.1 COMM domain-containing protein [Chloropicon primus]|eukprot:QDZ24205.1 COMM domain-containing protein [Chloropicon primus]